MVENSRPSWLGKAFVMAEIVYHGTARAVRMGHGNAVMSLAIAVFQTVLMVAAFYLMFSFLGLRGMKVRGDFLLYILTGIFLYLTHIKSVQAVAGAEGPTSPMMQHAPMNTIVAVLTKMLSTLYIQLISLFFIIAVYDMMFEPLKIFDPVACLGMVLLAWFSGAAVGMVFLAMTPWAPAAVKMMSMIYIRVNMLASGKMFVANTMPGFMLAMFDWNPLFHVIDQARGFAFVNYFPRNSNYEYTIWVSLVLITIGLMWEFFTRRRASASWSART